MVTFKAGDRVSLEDGIAYLNLSPGGAGDDTGLSYYVQCVVTAAPGVYLIPEVGVADFGKSPTGADEGSRTYFGAKWQINF